MKKITINNLPAFLAILSVVLLNNFSFAQCTSEPGCLVILGSPEYDLVISTDPFCCIEEWDEICEANYISAGGQPSTEPGCSTSTGCTVDPGCEADVNSFAYSIVTGNDPFCCSFSWDALCALAYTNEGGLPNPAVECIPDCPLQNLNIGESCDDGNPFSYNDVVQANCNCLGTPPQLNDIPCDAIPVSCNSEVGGYTFGAWPNIIGTCGTTDGTGGGGVWYVFTPSSTLSVTVNTCAGADFDTKLRVYTGSCENLQCLGGNDDFCDLKSQVSFTAVAGVSHYILVHGYNTAEGNFTLSVVCNPLYDCPSLNANIGDACTTAGSAGTVGANCSCIPDVVCNVAGGTISTSSPRLNLCKGDGLSNIIQLSVSGNIGIGRFGLVRQSDLAIIATNASGSFNMENYPASTYFVGHVSVLSLSALAGASNVNELSGCYDISNQLIVTSIPINGGTLSTTSPTTLCEGNVSVVVTGNQGANSKFVLLNQNATEVVIQNSTGVFNFNNRPPGTYKIVHFSHANGVNVAAIVPPILPACAAVSNLITVIREDCESAIIESTPNPSNGNTWVSVTLAADSYALLDVYDLSGRKVLELFNKPLISNQEYKIQLNGTSLPNGLYLYQLITSKEVVVKKFMIAR